MKLKSLEALKNPNRSAAIDFYRGIAVLAVLLFHFEPYFPFGNLGVELFFVLSGFLVGGILIEKYKAGRINYWEFILQRGFKIWPSFYFFLIVGNIIAYFLYHESHPDAYIPSLDDMKRYLLFYRNYTGSPDHWNFDHLWSLCIEEHFYILFPIVLIVLLAVARPNPGKLYFVIFSMIILGFIFKILTLYYTTGKDTISPTHNRIDSLAYGILLYQLINYFKDRKIAGRWIYALAGVILLISTIFINVRFHNSFFDQVVLWSVVPLFFAMIIFGTYHLNFRNFKIIRFIAYYSYNFYLWHTLLVYYIYDKFGAGFGGLLIYVFSSFAIAFVTTILVEEYFLSHRKQLIDRVLKFTNRNKKS